MESRERSTADGLDYKGTKGTVLFLYGGRRCFFRGGYSGLYTRRRQAAYWMYGPVSAKAVPDRKRNHKRHIFHTEPEGHKDEALCRRLAEKLCRETGRGVVCTGGFHIDNMKPEQIDEVVKALDGLADEIVSGIAGAGYSPLSTGF